MTSGSSLVPCVLHGRMFPVGTAVYWSTADQSAGCTAILSNIMVTSASYSSGTLSMTVKVGSAAAKTVTFAKSTTPKTLPTGVFCSTTSSVVTLSVMGTGVGATKRYKFAYLNKNEDAVCKSEGELLSGATYPLTSDMSTCDGMSLYSIKVSGSVVTVSFGDLINGNQTVALSACAAKAPAPGTYCGTFSGASYSLTWNADFTFSDTASLMSDPTSEKQTSLCMRTGLMSIANGQVFWLADILSDACNALYSALPIDIAFVSSTSSKLTFNITTKGKSTITTMTKGNCGLPAAGLISGTSAIAGDTAVVALSMQNDGSYTVYTGTAKTGLTCSIQGMFLVGNVVSPRATTTAVTGCMDDPVWSTWSVNGFAYSPSAKSLVISGMLSGGTFAVTLK